VNPHGLRLERLGAHHELWGFASGKDDLDSWLRRHALAAQQMDSARTYLLIRTEAAGNRVAEYISLTMGSVLRADAPAKLVRGLPAYPIGMVLLARLAVDRSEQGKALAGCCSPKRSARPSPPGRSPRPGSWW
jgi:hypothetical protein